MLPITNHRVFHIPHSLATLAAIAALVTALSWDSVDTERAAADVGARSERAVHLGTASADEERAAHPARDDDGGSVECDNCNGNGLSGLLPLVLPSVTAH